MPVYKTMPVLLLGLLWGLLAHAEWEFDAQQLPSLRCQDFSQHPSTKEAVRKL